MDTGILFTWANILASLGWLMLIFLPRFVVTRKVILSGWYCFGFAAAYLVCLVISVIQAGTAPDFSSIDSLTAIFSSEWGMLTGWVHYLCFDLFTGIWIKYHADRHKIPHLWIVVPLFFTFMLGPIGWASYFLIVKSRKARLFDR